MSSITKITLPAYGDVFRRERLLHRLDSLLHGPAVWISAPPGSGKTTMVSNYIDVRGLLPIWYRVDRGDHDVATFFYYMGLAAKKVSSRRQVSLPVLGSEYLMDIPAFTRRYFETLYGILGTPCVIVFDDCHEVPAGSPFYDVVREALSVLPADIHIILVSRDAPPPLLSRMRANRVLQRMGWQDLRFTEEESRSFIKLRGRPGIRNEEVGRICHITKGWAAGLVLLSEGSGPETGRKEHPDSQAEDEIFDYFAEEIFRGMNEPTRDFLCRTALLKEISLRSAAVVSGRTDAGKILSRLYRENCFTERHALRPVVYRFHPLFRSFLVKAAHDRFERKDLIRLRSLAAACLEEEGAIEEAAQLFLENGVWDSLSVLIARYAPSLLGQGRSCTLLGWLAALPEEMRESSPQILYWEGVCRMYFDLAGSRSFLERSYTGFRRGKDRTGAMLAWAGIVETYLHGMGALERLDHWIAVMNRLWNRHPGFPSPEVSAQVTPRIFAALLVRRPGHRYFEFWKEKAVRLLESNVDPTLRILTGFYLYTGAVWMGEYQESEYFLERLGEIALAGKASPLARITLHMAEAWAWLSGSCDKTIEAMNEGLRIASESGVRVWDFLLMIQGVAAFLADGDLENARVLLGRMAGVLEKGRELDRFYYNYENSWLALLEGDLPRALVRQEQALKFADATGLHYAQAQSRIAMSQLLHESGRSQEAKVHLDTGCRIGRRMKSRSVEYLGLLTRSAFSFDRGEDQSGLTELRRAMAVGREEGYVNFSWWRPGWMARLCGRALNSGIEEDYVRGLIRRRRLSYDESEGECTAWPWPVEIRTLGRFELVLEGVPLHFTGKVPKKPIEMLKVCIARGGANVSWTEISDILWPDAEGDAAYKSFGVTLIRLRRLIGKETVSFQDGRLTLDGRYCRVDALAFMKLIRKADARIRAGKTAAACPFIDQALVLYRGSFLQGEQGAWVLSRRDRLRAAYAHYAAFLGLQYERMKEWGKAAAFYRAAIESGGEKNEFRRKISRCFNMIGRM
ncbi:MAG: hypothetical protein GXP58_01185 [Deltaproteobacteria bacterium]|nr:hypothetical protein [Deltaproteobacteria bacterium]